MRHMVDVVAVRHCGTLSDYDLGRVASPALARDQHPHSAAAYPRQWRSNLPSRCDVTVVLVDETRVTYGN